jgi:hypothetical protein
LQPCRPIQSYSSAIQQANLDFFEIMPRVVADDGRIQVDTKEGRAQNSIMNGHKRASVALPPQQDISRR